jgi:hypothetical protein
LVTRKHKNNNILTDFNTNLPEQPIRHICSICSKHYKSRVGLWYHTKKCKPTIEIVDTPPPPDTNPNEQLILELLTKNKELMEILITQNKEVQNRSPATINQTNNQKFNINVFLNETCKNAMNFSDFIKNIQISYQDLENNAQLGFVGGISKIFIDNLKQLDISERPIHCTDVKRETMYIKDDNEWTKQTDDTKLQKAIQTVSYRSLGKLTEWKQENPDYKDCNSDFSNKCVDIQRNIIAGYERDIYYPKVIHALARECSEFSNKKGGK